MGLVLKVYVLQLGQLLLQAKPPMTEQQNHAPACFRYFPCSLTSVCQLLTWDRLYVLQNTYLGEALWLFFVLLILLMLGRAAFVFPLSFLHNFWSSEKLAKREMVVIW